MIREKFIDKLRKKYQSGGAASNEVLGFLGKKGITETAKAGLTRAAAATSGVSSTALGTLGRAVAPVGILSSLYGMYKSGQEHSGGKFGYKQNTAYVKGSSEPKFIKSNPFLTTREFQTGGQHTMPDGTVHPGATHEEYMAMMEQGQMQEYQQGGMYDQMRQYQQGGLSPAEYEELLSKMGGNTASDTLVMGSSINQATANKKASFNYRQATDMPYTNERTVQDTNTDKYTTYRVGPKKKQTGGTRLPGGEMEPIPGSDAVQFNGASHDQGGIMLDGQTEVEGGETMDQVNMAKKGGKRDYFFSSHLKKGGRSYADMHKDILRNGGNQEEINTLAKMQEVAAGRNPNKVQTAKLGGIMKYQNGGVAEDAYNKHEDSKPTPPTFELTPPKTIRKLKANANSIERMQHNLKLEGYQKKLEEFNASKAEHEQALAAYQTELSEWQATEVELSAQVEQEEMEERVEKDALDQKAIDDGYESNDQMIQAKEKEAAEKVIQKKEENDALVKKARSLNIDLPKRISSSDLKKLITQAEVTFEKQEGEEDAPKDQKIVDVGGNTFYLKKDSRLSNIANKLKEDFGKTWFNKVDPEILKEIGVNTLDEFLADGPNDSDIIRSYQAAWNKKNPNNQIDYDGDLGEQTLLTGFSKKEIDTEQEIDTDLDPNYDVQGGETLEIPIIEAKKEEVVPEEVVLDESEGDVGKSFPIQANLDYDVNLDFEGTPTSELLKSEGDKKKRTAGVPTQAYLGMAAGLIPAAYSLFHKQPKAEQAEYTPGFTAENAVIAEIGTAPRLERYDYNQDIANVGQDVRAMNKYIETSGGGPANMVNKMMAFSQGQDAKMKITAAETRANIGVQNTEAQLKQQMSLDNMKRAQNASIFNSQMIRAEAARKDQIDESNTARRQKRTDDMEFQKYAGVTSLASSLQTGFGDILDYKADMAMADAVGSDTGVYDRQVVGRLFPGYTEDEQGNYIKDSNKFGGLRRLRNYKK